MDHFLRGMLKFQNINKRGQKHKHGHKSLYKTIQTNTMCIKTNTNIQYYSLILVNQIEFE